jgi:uncharacterized repeat protein (TIGR01451 family)
MRTKTKTLVLAMTTALMASGAVHAQVKGDPGESIDPSGPSSGAPLGLSIAGQTCAGTGGSTNCPGAIADLSSLTSTFDVLLCTEVVDANVGIDTTHTWVGDLIYTVTSPGGAASVTIIDQPGTPPGSFGCSGNDIEAMLNDSAAAPVEDECAGPSPPVTTIDGIFTPNNPLAALNGVSGIGTWTLEVTDNAGGDIGVLNDWSLDLVCIDDADLAVAKSGPATVVAGTEMTYTIDVSNAGPANAVDVIVVDTIPAGTTYVSDTDSCVEAPAGTLTCPLGGIGSGAVDSFDVTVAVPASATTGTLLTNTAEVFTVTNDPNGANNSDTADTVVIREAAITVVKTQITPNPIVAGFGGVSNLCYNIHVDNAGPSNVTDLYILDTPEPYLGIVGVGISDFTIDLAAGEDILLPVCFTVLSGAPEGIFTNTATATGSGGGEDLGNPLNHTSSVDTPITRVATLGLIKIQTSFDPIVAGSGIGNMTHVVTVENFGPSDITGLVIDDDLLIPAGVIADSYIPSDGAFAAGHWTLNLEANHDATLIVTATVSLAAAEGIDVIVDTATVSGSAGGEELLGDTVAIETSSIRWPVATFNVNKLYAGGPGPSVPVKLVCFDDTALSFGDPGAGFTDTALVWKRFDTSLEVTTCAVVETVPDGYFELQRTADCDVVGVVDGGVYDCTLTNVETVARFHVVKVFSDGNNADVDVTLTCDTGLPLEQSLTITGGDPTGVTFVVKDYIDGTMSCLVTEMTNTPGYDVDTSGCVWNNVHSIDSIDPGFGCVVGNEAQDARFTAHKIWNIINDGGDEVNTHVPVTIVCDHIITGSNGVSDEVFSATKVLGDGDNLWVTVDTTTGPAWCKAFESITQSGVESTDDCYKRILTAGDSDSCTFVNTVFFEGIPTLSQYGLAILALLMLGVGMVGFRRFS